MVAHIQLYGLNEMVEKHVDGLLDGGSIDEWSDDIFNDNLKMQVDYLTSIKEYTIKDLLKEDSWVFERGGRILYGSKIYSGTNIYIYIYI